MLLILTLLVLAVVLCAVILYLPQAAGLTSVERTTHQKSQPKTHQEQYSGYIPPDEELKLAQANNKAGLREKVNVTKDDMPIRIKLSQDGTLRKRGSRAVGDVNPNNYDYDLDELIREETEGEAQRAQQEFYSKEQIGGDKEAMV